MKLDKMHCEKILTLYSDTVDFNHIHFLICQILTGCDEMTAQRTLTHWNYHLPFDPDHCQMVITGIPQTTCSKRYGWTQDDLFSCFAFDFQPMAKKLLDCYGYRGDSYLFLFDQNKFFVTIFSPKEEGHKKPAEELSTELNDRLQNIYLDMLFHGDVSFSNFTVLSDVIHDFHSISPTFLKICEQKKYHYFIHQCIAVSQNWIIQHQKYFIHASYNNVRTKFRTELMNNKTENLHEYLQILFYKYIIPSYDFYELRELLLFLEGNMKIYSMIYKPESLFDTSVFDYTAYDYADDCYAAVCRTLTQITETILNRKNYSGVIVNTLAYIQMNYQRPISIKEIADEVHLSPTYLSNIVTRDTGITIHNHILNIRMENAQKLLVETSLHISQISKMVGFDTVKYFTKKFKEHVGKTPSEYRKQMKSILL